MDGRALLDSATVFTVFYAIIFGGTLNRLSVWSAFWRDSNWEDWPRAIERISWSFVWFTLVPASYFAWVQSRLPAPLSILRSIGIFMSVLALNAFYRMWVGIVLWRKVDPRIDPGMPELLRSEGRWATLARYRALGVRNYIGGTVVSGGLAAFGLGNPVLPVG